MIDLIDFLTVCVRKGCTGLGADIIDVTEIIRPQKWTRHGLEDLIAILIYLQVHLLESR